MKESFRVLKPGGLIIATTWNRVDIMSIAADLMERTFGAKPEPPPMNPMALAEPGLFENMLEGAGFHEVEAKLSTYPFSLSSDADFAFKACVMLFKDKLEEAQAWDKARAIFQDRLSEYFARDESDTLIIEQNIFKCTTAKKPHQYKK